MGTALSKLRSRYGSLSPVILIASLVIVTGTWAFIEIADEVFEGSTQSIDDRILCACRNPDDITDPIGPEWLEEAMRDFTAIGGVAILTLMVVAVLGYMLMARKFHAFWLVLASTGGGILLGSVLKSSFARPRPTIVPHLSHIMTTSFPSGHSMQSAIIYLTLAALLARLAPGRKTKVYVIVVALGLIFLVGISRVYLGVHYPTDVLAGWMAGLVWALLCWLVARRLQQRGAVESDATTPAEI
ncbi:MAG: phosphatase PAP2 family protein [Planctomycetes bacterium]|nr:phosphatase PAP2 family protein [Planctomycetota bacterium]